MAAETGVVAPPAAADAPEAPAPGPAAPVPLSAADDALAAATAANQAMLVARARDHTATPHFGESQDQELRGQPFLDWAVDDFALPQCRSDFCTTGLDGD